MSRALGQRAMRLKHISTLISGSSVQKDDPFLFLERVLANDVEVLLTLS